MRKHKQEGRLCRPIRWDEDSNDQFRWINV